MLVNFFDLFHAGQCACLQSSFQVGEQIQSIRGGVLIFQKIVIPQLREEVLEILFKLNFFYLVFGAYQSNDLGPGFVFLKIG